MCRCDGGQYIGDVTSVSSQSLKGLTEPLIGRAPNWPHVAAFAANVSSIPFKFRTLSMLCDILYTSTAIHTIHKVTLMFFIHTYHILHLSDPMVFIARLFDCTQTFNSILYSLLFTSDLYTFQGKHFSLIPSTWLKYLKTYYLDTTFT